MPYLSFSGIYFDLRTAKTVLKFIMCLWVFLFYSPTGKADNSDRYTNESVLNSGTWIKVKISESGIYQISYTDLQNWGFSQPEKVKIYGYGGAILPEDFTKPYIDDLPEIPVYRENNRILFYAQGTEKWTFGSKGFTFTKNPYSTAGYYFLTQNDSPEIPIETQPANDDASLSTITSYIDYALHKKELINISKSGRNFYGEDFKYNARQTFTFDIPGIVPDTDVDITAVFVAKSNNSSIVSIDHNGVKLSEKSIRGQTSNSDITYENGVAVSLTSKFKSNPNSPDNITVTFTGSNAKMARLDYILLNFQRELKLYGNSVLFHKTNIFNTKQRFSVNTGNADDVKIWDVTTPHTPISIECEKTGNYYNFCTTQPETRDYIAFRTSGTYPSPEFVGKVANQNLHGLERADLVILVPNEFKNEAERLAEFHRQHDNLSVLVVTPQPIYNEFSSGTPDATAIRRFMKMFYDRAGDNDSLKPLYLLLFGDGSYDNRHITEEWQSYNYPFLLTYQSENSLDERQSYVTDDYFGFLDDSEGRDVAADKLDLGIGRFPVRTLTEAANAVDKVISYATNTDYGTWKNDLCFVADDGNNGAHMELAENAIKEIVTDNPEFLCNKIYIDAYQRVVSSNGATYPDAKKKMMDMLNDGLLLINYSGHGNTTSWTAEKMLEMSDIKSLYLKRLPLFITATCDFSRFDDKATTGGEEIFLNPKGGGIALFTTTRVVYTNGNDTINKYMAANLFRHRNDGSRFRLGDIMKEAKCMFKNRDRNKLNFVLLGDPALKLTYPEYKLVVTEINGQPLTENSQDEILLKARSTVTIKGEVRNYSTGNKLSDYNGIISPRLFDSEVEIITHGNADGGTPFTFKERSNLLFTGNDSIKNGEFLFTFKMPREINYSMEPGLLNLYSNSSDGREAQGSCNAFRIGEYDDSAEEDFEGPEIINMYLNTEGIKDGGIVNETPVFFAEVKDPSGINISGIGIGHNMTLKIDNREDSEYILNNYFKPSTEVYGKGSVIYQMPELTAGDHTLLFKVWDIEGNSNEEEISFTVKPGLKPRIFDLKTQQNPVRDIARFYITTDRPNANIELSITICDLMGRKIWWYSDKGRSDLWTAPIIEWDLTDLSGRRVPPGIYIYRAVISTDTEKEATKSKKIVVLGQ
ncbi:type IX secretion system sortase PorU [Coprobacter tertius]|uniref:Type IX secretion system sortase PorU n=1 Tax=Coprobacter tertius TaxID=2944915 RepID=A0ABT1MDS3_9BACT|nr:type IX secretion system sortase PorU [Coprobacter tertius]MCP9610783.1 type IX secretion system sortase PorU [Coprobacter tertius]